MKAHCLWFRHDLRVTDNPIIKAALHPNTPVIAIYAVTPETWQAHHWAPRKVEFVLAQVQQLQNDLHQLGIPLEILQLHRFADVPLKINEICQKHHITALFVNRHYGLDERRCEQQVQATCNVAWHTFDANWLVSPDRLLNQQGRPYHVFTAFKRQVLQYLEAPVWAEVGNSEAEQQLLDFCRHRLADYHRQRDFPSLEGTSQLSHYLAQGVLSPYQCIAAMMQATGGDSLSALNAKPGPATWLNELLWREFYQHLVWHYPNLCKGEAFKPKTDALNWSTDSAQFEHWCKGNTGFPLVDAAMRQLNQTGWMHNRLRMVTAMFLTKTLFINWRLGERYFMEHLIDGDFAANNGGWQWCASTGTDAVPYFRIFNPTTQSQRFDPEGAFIRRYCPELSRLNNRSIHCPTSVQRQQCAYPEPIVDYTLMRKKVIHAFQML